MSDTYDIWLQQETPDGELETLHFERPQFWLAKHFAEDAQMNRPNLVSIAMCSRKPGSMLVYFYPSHSPWEPGGDNIPYIPSRKYKRR